MHIGDRSFEYDANGNQTGWQNDSNDTRRTIVWDEENRIREVQDPKHGAAFSYDDQGERKLRKSQYGETAYINQFFTVRNGAIASTHVFAGTSRIVTKVGAGTPVGKVANLKGTGNLNPNSPTGGDIVVGDIPVAPTSTTPQLVVRPGTTATPTTTTTGATSTTTTTTTTATTSTTPLSPASGREPERGQKDTFPGQGIAHRSDRANEVARNSEKNKHLNGGDAGGDAGSVNSNAGGNGNTDGTSNNPGSTTGGNTGGGNAGGVGGGTDNGGNTSTNGNGGGGQGNGREFIFFYHPDHLGSTGYVTDEKALRYEHITYFPFGETWVQESNATWRVPYQFTSKEMDQETGLYYFGARYYDPRTSVWQSPDPILEEYLPMVVAKIKSKMNRKLPADGVYKPLNLNLYTYSYLSPVVYNDPTGLAPPIEHASPLYVTSRFGPRNIPESPNSFHAGADIRAPVGTDVISVSPGIILRAGEARGGSRVIIRHDDGSITWSRHMSPSVQEGQRIGENDVIGRTCTGGSCGTNQPHLHFERQEPRATTKTDPVPYIRQEEAARTAPLQQNANSNVPVSAPAPRVPQLGELFVP